MAEPEKAQIAHELLAKTTRLFAPKVAIGVLEVIEEDVSPALSAHQAKTEMREILSRLRGIRDRGDLWDQNIFGEELRLASVDAFMLSTAFMHIGVHLHTTAVAVKALPNSHQLRLIINTIIEPLVRALEDI